MIKAILRNHIVRLAEIAESFCSQKKHNSRHWDDKNSGIYNLRWNYRKTILHEEWVCIAPAHLFLWKYFVNIFYFRQSCRHTMFIASRFSRIYQMTALHDIDWYCSTHNLWSSFCPFNSHATTPCSFIRTEGTMWCFRPEPYFRHSKYSELLSGILTSYYFEDMTAYIGRKRETR